MLRRLLLLLKTCESLGSRAKAMENVAVQRRRGGRGGGEGATEEEEEGEEEGGREEAEEGEVEERHPGAYIHRLSS